MMSHQYFKVDVFSHHFVLSRVTPRGREVIEGFARNYIQYGLVKQGRRFVRAPVKVFGSRVADYSEYRFHIEQYAEFTRHLSNMQILPHTYEVTFHDFPESALIDIEALDHWTSKDYQEPIIEYLVADVPKKAKLLEIQTGKGKTYCAMKAITLLKRRTCIIVKPMYIEKWVSDIEAITGIKGEDVVVVQGSAQLMALIAQGKEGVLSAKFIVISNRTLQNWYSLYEKVGKEILNLGYDCLPGQLFPVLGVGMRLIDEVHQDFHLNFKLDLYTHVERSISLSATLKGDDPFLNRMYETAYPKPMRYAGLAYDKYIYAYAWVYRVHKPELLRTMEYGSTTYSHHAFEKSVMRNKKLLDDYLDMIVAASMRFHFEKYQKGDKLLIYCASIQMCTLVVEHLKASFKGVDVRRYVEDDPYENLLEPDVRVSTLLSAGTGHDIPGLTTVILTTAISSSQSNIQGFGRLRKLPDKRMQFVYFVCSDVPKHMEYHERKKELLKTMALEYDGLPYHHPLG